MAELTWSDVLNAEVGKVFIDRMEDGLRFIVLRGPASLCAYVGVPLDHPLAGHNYEDVPVRAHGGLTFAQEGNGKYLPTGRFWYGWDYAHCDDFCIYDEKYDRTSNAKKWTPEEVNSDSWSTIWDFKSLLKLSEQIAHKAAEVR